MVDPLYSRFLEQRSKAKQRGIAWQLPYWEWLQIWEESGHLPERGRRKGEFVMARNRDRGPYAAAKVRIIRVETNNYQATLGRPKRPRRRLNVSGSNR
jgi:hypothetical protein